MNTIFPELTTPEDVLSKLEKDTPIIDEAHLYKRELTDDEIRQYESHIAKLTIGILNDQDRQKEIADRIKAASLERTVHAEVLESGEIDEICKAVKFYTPSDNMIAVYIKKDDGYHYLNARTATPYEAHEWKRLQEAIRQTEIEAGYYRQQLSEIAGYANSES